MASFDLGPSLVNRYTTVDAIVEERFPVSGKLALLACASAIPLGLALGLAGALRRSTWVDWGATGLAPAMLVIPVFLVAGTAHTYLVREWEVVPGGWESGRTRALASLVLARLALDPRLRGEGQP